MLFVLFFNDITFNFIKKKTAIVLTKFYITNIYRQSIFVFRDTYPSQSLIFIIMYHLRIMPESSKVTIILLTLIDVYTKRKKKDSGR